MKKITTFKLFESLSEPSYEERAKFRLAIREDREDDAIDMIKKNPEFAHYRRQIFVKTAAEFGKVKLLKYMLDNCDVNIPEIKNWMSPTIFHVDGEYSGATLTEEEYEKVLDLLAKY